MDTKPLANYIKSLEALKSGDRQSAELYLAAATGVTKVTPYMSQNLDKLANSDEPNEVILTVLMGEMI